MARQKLARRGREETEAEATVQLMDMLPEHVSPRGHAVHAKSVRTSKSKKKTPAPAYWRTRSVKIEPIFDQKVLDTPAQMNVAQVEQSIRISSPDINTMHMESILSPKSEGSWTALETPFQQTQSAPSALATPSVSEMISLEGLALEQQMRTPEQMQTGAVEATRVVEHAPRPNVLEQFAQFMSRMARRIQALLTRLQGPTVTPSGQMAMRQLQRLFSLISAGFAPDDMEMVRLRVAFGEAYYHVMDASRRRKTHRRADRPDEYQAYIERFLRAEHEDVMDVLEQ